MPRLKNATKKDISGLYNSVAENYDQIGPKTFSPFGKVLIEQVQIQPGMRILDIGTGRGATLFPASQALGDAGLAVGIDLAWEMIYRTQQDISHRPIDLPTALAIMDGEELGLASNSFDVIVCGFAFFFLDPGKALFEFKRVLKAGGKLAISLIQRVDPRWAWYDKQLVEFHERHHLPLYTGQRGVGELTRAFAITKELQLEKFTHIQIKTHAMEVHYPDPDTWWQSKWTHGARYPLEHIPPPLLSAFHEEVMRRVEKMDLSERWRLACVLAER